MVLTLDNMNGAFVNGLLSPGHAWAIPFFTEAGMMQTFKDVPINATYGTVTASEILVSNAASVVEIAPEAIDVVIRENTNFYLNFTFNATNIDELTVKVGFASINATFVSCDNGKDDPTPFPYVSQLFYTAAIVEDATAEDGILTIPVPTTEATIDNDVANYEYTCEFTAGAYNADQTDAAVSIDVILGEDSLKTAQITVPAFRREPLSGTKLTVDIIRSSLFNSAEINALLNALVKAMKSLDSTFDISRLFQVTQKLNLVQSSSSSLHLTADQSTVTLSTSFTGVSVTDTAALAADTKSSVEELGYEADVAVESADIEVTCTEGCGSEECGLCLDGHTCTSADQCFSAQCENGKCGSNSAASVSVALCVVISAIASIMLW
jgi:hypothetical protein